jgi:hypothetical protein
MGQEVTGLRIVAANARHGTMRGKGVGGHCGQTIQPTITTILEGQGRRLRGSNPMFQTLVNLLRCIVPPGLCLCNDLVQRRDLRCNKNVEAGSRC